MKTTEKLEKHSIGLEDCLYQEENHYFKKASIGLEDCPYQEENHYFEKSFRWKHTRKFYSGGYTNEFFIIMMANKNGIAVSTDSKSTNIDNTNQYYEEGNRLAKKYSKQPIWSLQHVVLTV